MANPMNDVHRSLYDDAHRYDLVSGTYATGHFLDFYKRQIARHGEPSLELACGTGRLTIPLAEAKIDVTGIDRSEQMLELAGAKAVEALLAYNGFTVEQRYGGYDETPFSSTSPKQPIVCYPTELSDKSSS
jgi:2-polyprenyl-3-methyl-5-hydroxy-6-metoxy-1,4-benzoquinol methylase